MNAWMVYYILSRPSAFGTVHVEQTAFFNDYYDPDDSPKKRAEQFYHDLQRGYGFDEEGGEELLSATLCEVKSSTQKSLLDIGVTDTIVGYQIVKKDSDLPEIPENFHSWEILSEKLADSWLAANNEEGIWEKQPVREGEIEEPEFLTGTWTILPEGMVIIEKEEPDQ